MEAKKLNFEEEMRLFMEALKQSRIEADARMKNIKEQLGGIGNNNGYFAEEFFYSSFEKGTINFFGERFDRIMKNLHFPKTVVRRQC